MDASDMTSQRVSANRILRVRRLARRIRQHEFTADDRSAIRLAFLLVEQRKSKNPKYVRRAGRQRRFRFFLYKLSGLFHRFGELLQVVRRSIFVSFGAYLK
jgi:hypothetical protein